MSALGKLLVCMSLVLPSVVLAADVPELPMKIYGTVVGSGTVDAYVGDALLASVPVVDGTIGYAPHIFLVPGTVPEGTTVVLKANKKELQRFAFNHGGSQEVSLVIPAEQSSVAAAAMIIVDEAVAGVSTLTQTSIKRLSRVVGSVVDGATTIAEQVVVSTFDLFSSPSEEVAVEGVLSGAEGEREGFVTYTGEEKQSNSLLAAAGAVVPDGAWPWIGGITGLVGLGGLAFARFRG